MPTENPHNQLIILCPGSMVALRDIEARILRVIIEENDHVSYVCSWWDNRTWKVDTFPASHVTPLEFKTRSIGYETA